MKTYIFQETDSSVRSHDACIIVHHIIRNRPHFVGSSDHNTASWRGAHAQAVAIIHKVDGIQYGTDRDGGIDRYSLRGELGPVLKYDDLGRAHNAVRLFEI